MDSNSDGIGSGAMSGVVLVDVGGVWVCDTGSVDTLSIPEPASLVVVLAEVGLLLRLNDEDDVDGAMAGAVGSVSSGGGGEGRACGCGCDCDKGMASYAIELEGVFVVVLVVGTLFDI